METKDFSGMITAVKQSEKGGVPIGIIEGYIATWDVDSGNDRFVKGAFAEHLEYMRKNNKTIKLKAGHEETIGLFPIETVKEDDIGLFGAGEINLDVQRGREKYSLAKQGAINEFSVGYRVKKHRYESESNIRVIEKSEVWEGSLVDRPMNSAAIVTAVKEDEWKPYPNEHAARINNPDKYEKVRRQNDKFGEGIHAIFGITKDGKTELQAIRFDSSKFTPAKAKEWLKEHDHKPIEFEDASGGKLLSLTDIKGMGKSDLVKLFRSTNMSKDAADRIAQFTMSGLRIDDIEAVNTVALLNDLADRIESSTRRK